MTPSRYRQSIRAAELVTPDHWPVCARCGDYSLEGEQRCGTCSAPLASLADLRFVAEMRAGKDKP